MNFLKRFGFIFFIISFLLISGCKQGEFYKSILKNQSHSVVKVVTSKGNFFIELFNEDSPITVENFLNYVRDGFYDKTIFHRVIDNFMIQGGGFDSEMTMKVPQDPIKNEAINGLSNVRGTVSMARTLIVDSATSQFFINVNDNTFLDHKSINPENYGYAVFGRVIDGMDVVDAINSVRTGSIKAFKDVPKDTIEITKIIIIQ